LPLLYNLLSNKVIFDVEVLRSPMKLGIFGYRYSRLIVLQYQGWLKIRFTAIQCCLVSLEQKRAMLLIANAMSGRDLVAR
jgi:hypothetical protein